MAYEQMLGWKQTTKGCTVFDKLPSQAQQYVQRIENATGIRAAFLGTGQERTEMIIR